ncbi:MAG: polyphosphate polymerase domain-containing protein [Lachnospiraceae bacterium]|nr:polyphosphate polymerase domain-containing protein [Lachnospiraceae bacterium]
MSKRFRHECKYILNPVDAALMREAVSSICEPDTHAGCEGSYRVRSLYFDTLDDQYLSENLAGVNLRHKYRIRVYNCDSDRITLERKETEIGLKHKDSCLISLDQCNELMKGNFFVPFEDKQVVLQEMCAEHMLKFLRPAVIVDYLRIPYVYPSGNVRITFDHNVSSSARTEDFLNKDAMISPVLFDNSVVLEIKYDDLIPHGIRNIICRHSLNEQTAFSKYVYARSNIKNG